MSPLHKVIFLVALAFAVVWTFLLWRISRDDKRRFGIKCAHRWHRLEDYANGRAKARCLTCGRIAIVKVRGSSPAGPTREG